MNSVRGWHVQVNGVKAVLDDTVHAAKPLEKHSKALGHEMQSAADAAGNGTEIDIVATALQGFAQHAEQALPHISNELNTVLKAAVKATRAYIEGDERMAVEAEREAARATGILPPPHEH